MNARMHVIPYARRCLAALALGALIAATGCSASQPLDAWQDELEHYVQQQGQGNPNVLAAMSPRATHRTFDNLGPESGLIGRKRTDTRGLLVGHRQYNDRLWFVYLVGIVEDQGGVVDVNFDAPVVQDIRPVAFARARDRFRWAKGESPDPPTVQQYLADQRQRWARGRPDRRAQDKRHTRFPRPWDRFILKGHGSQLIIEHAQTGATWTLTLPESTRIADADG